MGKNRFFNGLSTTLTFIEGAREAAAAVNANRKPSRASLKKLGLEGDAFDSVNFGDNR
ncbi:MAG TPA: hypothetical protein VGM83_16655 [Devosiaceae bacterium]|jgi:hypothetical protein